MAASSFKIGLSLGGPTVNADAMGKTTLLPDDRAAKVLLSIGGPPVNTATVGYTAFTGADRPGWIPSYDASSTPTDQTTGQIWPPGPAAS